MKEQMDQYREIVKDLVIFLIIITLSIAGSVYMIWKNHWQLLTGNVWPCYFFTLGYVILAYRRVREYSCWKKNVLPTFSVFEKSLANCLVLFSTSKRLKDAYDDRDPSYKTKFQEFFNDFLEKKAPDDFEDRNHQEGGMPYGTRLENLSQKALVPIRDLLRWAMLMDRLYVLRDSDRTKKRLRISLMELVVNLCLVECELMIKMIVDENIYYSVVPEELNYSNISFSEIAFFAEEEDPFHFVDISKEKKSKGAERLISIFNEMFASGIDLSKLTSIPDYPYCINVNEEKKEFIEMYLTIAWFRSVIDCIGWNIVNHRMNKV